MVRTSLLLAVVAAAALFVAAAAEPRIRPTHVASYTFDAFVRDFRRAYAPGSEEYEMRRELFESRKAGVLAHNKRAEEHGYTQTLNRFADRTKAEKYNGYVHAPKYKSIPTKWTRTYTGPAVPPGGLPASVDWRDAGIITAVKDQGQCGSCYAHAAAETLESYVAMASEDLPVLSQQQMASCTSNPKDCGGSGGCGGGIPQKCWESNAAMGGVASTWTYPYVSYWGENQKCLYNNSVGPSGTPADVVVDGVYTLPTNNYTAVMNHLALVGPLAISVDASNWHNYDSGVYTGCTPEDVVLDHNVQLVGYGTDQKSGMPYWLVRNSWGVHFGERGYIRLLRHESNAPCAWDNQPGDGDGCNGGPSRVMVCGTCGILYDTTYPSAHPTPNSA